MSAKKDPARGMVRVRVHPQDKDLAIVLVRYDKHPDLSEIGVGPWVYTSTAQMDAKNIRAVIRLAVRRSAVRGRRGR